MWKLRRPSRPAFGSHATITCIGRNNPAAPSYSHVVGLSDREISAAIIESCRAGDREAFRALYDTYKDRVYSIALHFFHSEHAVAADVTQQVFLKVMTGIGQFRGDSAFSTWLYRLVVNACLDVSRRRAADASAAARTRQESIAPGSQEDEYARVQRATSVRAAISTLPPKFRVAVLLRYFDDLSYEEMAEALGCSMGTVASRLSRGHKMLADCLSQLKSPKG
jgi:RNA polymerase sigma-70 factor, ECF subfamily